MGRQQSLLALIVVLAIAAVTVIVAVPMQLGLDLQGGTQLTLRVLPTEAVPKITPDKLSDVQRVVENRINGLGVSEAVVQTIGDDQLSVQLPGVSDPEQAERVLGGTAQLDFREQRQGTESQLNIEFNVLGQKKLELEALKKTGDQAAIKAKEAEIEASDKAIAPLFDKTSLTGESLKTAAASPLGGDAWEVVLDFDEKGAEGFANLTKNVAGTGRSLGIFLDDRLLSAPKVDAPAFPAGLRPRMLATWRFSCAVGRCPFR
jgi:preprotein translocase subunit SecD